MRLLFSTYLILLTFTIIERSQSKPLEIIYKGGDCVCAQPGARSNCEYALSPAQILPAGRGISNSHGCSQPRYRVKPMNNHIKYIYDYNVEIPNEPRKMNIPLTDLFARVDKILIETDSAKRINNDCASNIPAAKQCQCAQCSVHSSRPCENNQFSNPRYLHNVSPSFFRIPQETDRVYIKEAHPLLNKLRTNQGRHKIRRRDLSEVNHDSSIKEAFSSIRRVHLLPQSIYFKDEKRSGHCFRCCLSPNSDRELLCDLDSASCCSEKAYQETGLNAGMNLPTYSDSSFKAFEKIPAEKLTEPQLRNYMEGVLHSHGDFFAAMQPGPIMSTPIESQETAARRFLQKLMQEQNQSHTRQNRNIDNPSS